jgi:hypothetical protein
LAAKALCAFTDSVKQALTNIGTLIRVSGHLNDQGPAQTSGKTKAARRF